MRTELIDFLTAYLMGWKTVRDCAEWLAGIDWDDSTLGPQITDVAGRMELLVTEVLEGLRPEAEFWQEAAKFVESETNSLYIQPLSTAPFEARCGYVNRAYLSRSTSQRYYLDCLLDDIALRVRAGMAGMQPVERVALALSKSWHLAVMLIRALEPEHVLLVMSADARELYSKCRGRFPESLRGRIEPMSWDRRDFASLARDMSSWLGRTEHSARAMVEITGGTTAMSACLLLAAQSAGAHVAYLEHEWNGRPLVGTETVCVIDTGALME